MVEEKMKAVSKRHFFIAFDQRIFIQNFILIAN